MLVHSSQNTTYQIYNIFIRIYKKCLFIIYIYIYIFDHANTERKRKKNIEELVANDNNNNECGP